MDLKAIQGLGRRQIPILPGQGLATSLAIGAPNLVGEDLSGRRQVEGTEIRLGRDMRQKMAEPQFLIGEARSLTTQHQGDTYAGPACNRTPNAFVTLRIVAKLGLPSSLKAR